VKVFVHSAILVLNAVFFAGCAWVPQTVTINPRLNVPSSNVGKGAAVTVNVLDLRASPTTGHRGVGSKGAEITVDPDLGPVFQRKLAEGLTQLGFKVVPFNGQSPRLLRVEIKNLEYTSEMEFWQGTVKTKASIQAYSRAGDAVYNRTYVAEKQQKAQEAPGAKTNEQLLNAVVSDVLEQLLGDQRLLALLAS